MSDTFEDERAAPIFQLAGGLEMDWTQRVGRAPNGGDKADLLEGRFVCGLCAVGWRPDDDGARDNRGGARDLSEDEESDLIRQVLVENTRALAGATSPDEILELFLLHAARERQRAAEERAAELQKANAALQETINALAAAGTLREIVPTMLGILSRTFGAKGCGFYEVDETGRVFLRYFAIEGRVLTPGEMAQDSRDEADRAVLERLTGGFTVADAYLGANVRKRKGHNVIDHVRGTIEPEFDGWTRRRGWPLELNVPLVVEGESIAAITLMRAAPEYSESEIDLAIALARQLTLAVQAVRLSERTAELAVARALSEEREQAAQVRAAELARVNEALRRGAEQISAERDVQAIAQRFLRQSQSLVGADGSAVMLAVPGERNAFRVEAVMRGHMLSWAEIESDPYLGRFAEISAREELGLLEELKTGKISVVYVPDIREAFPRAYEYHARFGHAVTWKAPLLLRGAVTGYLGFAFKKTRNPTQFEAETLMALAHQVVLALELTRLAEDAKATALAEEREQFAQQRASELARANEAMRRGVNGLLAATSAEEILTGLLKEAVHISGATSGAVLRRVEGTEFSYAAILAGGVIRTAGDILQSGTDAEMRRASRLDPSGHFGALARGEARWRMVDDPDLAAHLKRSANFHRQTGNRLIFDSPYSVGQAVGGYLGLAFQGDEPPSQGVRETITALSNQVGLALEFRRISEENKRAALQHQRNAFARDLHDTLAQGFTGILMQLGSLEQSRAVPAEMAPYLDRIDELARTNLAEARRTVEELRYMEDAKETFSRRLAAAANGLRSAFGAEVELEFNGEEAALDPWAERELLLIAREGLTNAIKHSKTDEIGVKVFFHRDGIQIRVWDNGSGFSWEENGNSAGHYGMQSMQERAEQIGASLTVVTEKGYGTELVVSWRAAKGAEA